MTTATDGTTTGGGTGTVDATAPTDGTTTGGGTDTVDATAPTVLSVSPSNGTKGVTADTPIVLTFSKPMDKGSVASAVSVTGFVTGDLGLQWNADATTLTISPAGGLKYAAGTSSSGMVARTYTVSVTNAARDAKGTALGAALSSSFATLRRVTWSIPLEKVIETDTYMYVQEDCTTPLAIGGWQGGVSSGDYIAYVIFDVSSLDPASEMYAIESAKLFALQTAQTGNFYDISSVQVSKIKYWPGLHDIQNYSVLAELGVLSTSDTPAVVSIEAVDSFREEFVSGGVMKHMYRLSPTPTSASFASKPSANFDCDAFSFDVTYLIQ